MLCACGCGGQFEEIYRYRKRKYISGHQMRGRIRLDQSLRMLRNTINFGRISSDEKKEKISVANSGENNGMFGKHYPSRNKGISHRSIKKCLVCNKEISFYATHCRNHVVINTPTGKNNLQYKNPEDRITPLNESIRKLDKYFNWRTQVFGRDNFTCQECVIRGTWLEAHHIKSVSDIIKEFNITTKEEAIVCDKLWNIDNGITYCKKCHDLLKNRGGVL